MTQAKWPARPHVARCSRTKLLSSTPLATTRSQRCPSSLVACAPPPGPTPSTATLISANKRSALHRVSELLTPRGRRSAQSRGRAGAEVEPAEERAVQGGGVDRSRRCRRVGAALHLANDDDGLISRVEVGNGIPAVGRAALVTGRRTMGTVAAGAPRECVICSPRPGPPWYRRGAVGCRRRLVIADPEFPGCARSSEEMSPRSSSRPSCSH